MSSFIPEFVSRMFRSNTTDELISELKCPLTGHIMIEPVIASNGITYERSAIEAYLSNFKTDEEISSPDKQTKIERKLFPNLTLKEKIKQYLEKKHPNEMLHVSHSFGKSLYESDTAKTLVLTISPNSNAIQHKPKGNNVVIILDVSASMDTSVVSMDTDSGESGFKLSRLDMVKHATLATSKMLGPSDNLCIITYSTTSKIVFPFTSMTDSSKVSVETIIKQINTDSSTNFCPAIELAFDNIHLNDLKSQHTSILFLTDGEPSDDPEVILQKLSNNMNTTPNTIFSTFIFGNNANSKLLKQMAEVGQGMYSFIPDVSMIGTVFSNFIANVKDTVIPFAKITIHNMLGFDTITPHKPQSVFNIHSKTPKNICYQLNNRSENNEPFTITFTIDSNNTKQYYEITSDEDINVLNIAVQNMRNKFINDITLAAASSNLLSSQNIIKDLHINIKTLLCSYPNNPFLEGMLRDLESPNPEEAQITKAFSQQSWFNSWGKHYALSVARANMLEETSNYKTPSIAPYANQEFIRIRDMADTTFVSIPPPEPSIKPYGRSTYTPSATAASNLAANFYGGCLDGDCPVNVECGKKYICDIKKGDVVTHSKGVSRVKCLVRHDTHDEETEYAVLCVDDEPNILPLKITKWHPVKTEHFYDGQPTFPNDIVEFSKLTSTNYFVVEKPKYVYNIVMEEGDYPWFTVNGFECVALGHGEKVNTVLAHDYYAEKVIDDLKLLEGWDNGYVTMYGKKIRDKSSGIVIGIE